MISAHVTLREATFSQTAIQHGIDNTPDKDTIVRMKVVAKNCFEPLREWYGNPIKVNSFYRCPALNKAVKGSPTSQHVKGEAMDLNAGSRAENKKLFDWMKANLKFDQLIWEYGNSAGPDWVHVSFREGKNRQQVIRVK